MQPVMPSWPDILAKYNLILSQTHSFSNTLVSSNTFDFEKIALHPNSAMTDAQLDTDVAPLLRNQQTLDVLSMENETVRRLSEHMSTRGSLGVLSTSQKKSEYEDVLQECAQIRDEHDRRVERAVRAVTMLKEKYDWKTRVEVEQAEPEELTWGHPAEQSTDEDESDEDEEGGRSNEENTPPAATPSGDVTMKSMES